MNDNRRFKRVQWGNNPSAEGAESVESSPTPWAVPPAEESATSWRATPMGSNPTSWTGGSVERGSFAQTPSGSENDFSSWASAPAENNPMPWAAAPQVGSYSASWGAPTGESGVPQEEGNASGTPLPEEAYNQAYAPAEYDPQAEEFYAGEMYEDGMYEEGMYEDEEAFLEEQRAQEEADRRTLRDALLILVALYIICGIAPLFMGLFVPLRIFFWLEIGGWAIILAWLIIGVRRPLMHWFRERARKRAEQEASEQIPS